MERYLISKGLYKLSGNGQCKCAKCGCVCWTDWFYEYNGKVYDRECLENEIQEDIMCARANVETYKITYTDRHLQILELQRLERKDLKNIIKAQNEEMQISDTYSKLNMYLKGGD